MKASSQGVLEPSEHGWQREQVCPHARWRPRVGRRKIDNNRDFRKNSVSSFYPNYPNHPNVNRSVRVMGETGNSWRERGLILELCGDLLENALVNQSAESLTKFR